MPKELLPIVDKPLIQYAAEEAIAAGIDTLIFVTGRNKRAIEDHFDANNELETMLRAKGKDAQADMVRNIIPEGVGCIFVRQAEQLGLGHAVLCADPENRELSAPPPEPRSVIQLDEAEGKTALASWGLTTPMGVTGSAGQVIAEAETLGFPLAVKLLSADLAHKNHAGAVHLNVSSKPALEDAIEAIRMSVRAYDPALSTECFLIERMVASPRAEFIVGISYKPGLGHALVIGRGGTAVEELKDYATLLLPAGHTQIEDALASLKISGKLRLSDTERTALVTQIQAVAAFAEQHRSSLVELDVNPIILDSDGRATAVDALLRLRRE